MIEKMAFAIFATSFHSEDIADGTAKLYWDENRWPDDKRRAHRCAQAALSALLDPDAGMVDAGWDAIRFTCDDAGIPRSEVPGVFKAMITAAGRER